MNKEQASHNTPPAEEDRGEPDDSWKEALEGDLFGLVGSAALAAGVTVTVEQSLAIAHAVMRYMLADESLPLLSSPRVEEVRRIRKALNALHSSFEKYKRLGAHQWINSPEAAEAFDLMRAALATERKE